MDKRTTLFAGIICLCLSYCLIVLIPSCNCKNRGSSGSRNSKNQVIPKDSVASVNTSKANYNIYIENSGSMDGYVEGVTEFEQSVYSLISDLRISNSVDSLNLNYINSQVIKWGMPNAQNLEIKDFIEKLDPTTFRLRGGDRKHSDLQDVFKQVLNATTPNNVSVVVSDCIFSPGKNLDAGNYLINQQIGFKTAFAQKLDSLSFSTLIMQFTSKFTGLYYDKTNTPQKLSAQYRPFYITIIGAPTSIDKFLSIIKFEKYKQKGLLNSYLLSNPKKASINGKIIRDYRVGDFKIAQPASSLTIINAKSKDNIFQFSFATDLSKFIMDDTYLRDAKNYKLSPNYKIVSIKANNDETNTALKGFSHIFTISTDDLKQDQDVKIELVNKVPDWVSESSSIDDSNILSGTEIKKTFGLAFLIDGISEAYDNKTGGAGQFAITVKVSKNNSGSSDKGSHFPWVIFVLIGLIVGVIIWLKNKK